MKTIAGGVVAPRGYLCAGVSCGIKTAHKALDLGMILSQAPAVAACVFTTNRAKAASVLLNQQRLGRRRMQGLVVNAGNANACTGERGMRDARRMTELAAQRTGVSPEAFLVASTGVIGHHLPMSKVEAGIRGAAESLGRTLRHNSDISRAIMTTDIVPKATALEFRLGGRMVRIGGIAKGSGMIAPNMATMLAFITTDCAINTALLRKALRQVVERTFNCVTVDGDCSTNDTLALLANGAAGNRAIIGKGAAYDLFAKALCEVCERLAKAIARDGEGATKLVTVWVTGAHSISEARQVARKIAESPLVKTAIHGGDPNWGRIICAAGYSGAPVEPEKMRLKINGVQLFRHGLPCGVRQDRLASCMKPKEITLHLDLGRGGRETTMWTCDFSKEYITINAEYHT